MNKLEQAARQALEFIEQVDYPPYDDEPIIIALREALAEQAEQKPVGKIVLGQYEVPYIDWTSGVKVEDGMKLYAAPVRTKDYNPDVIFNDDGTFSLTLPDGDELRIIPPQQEPTAEVTEDGYAWGKDGILPANSLLYAAPVRTKDLTDDEIATVTGYRKSGATWPVVEEVARAVIAADRKKNK